MCSPICKKGFSRGSPAADSCFSAFAGSATTEWYSGCNAITPVISDSKGVSGERARYLRQAST